jgi:hypothetical protein
MDDAGLNDWIELPKQAIEHDRQMKQLVVNHMEDQWRPVRAVASNDTRDPQELGPNKQANKMVASSHGQAYS